MGKRRTQPAARVWCVSVLCTFGQEGFVKQEEGVAIAHGAECWLVCDTLAGTVVQSAILALGTEVMVISRVSVKDPDSV